MWKIDLKYNLIEVMLKLSCAKFYKEENKQ